MEPVISDPPEADWAVVGAINLKFYEKSPINREDSLACEDSCPIKRTPCNQDIPYHQEDFLLDISKAIRPGEKLDLILRSSDDREDLLLGITTVYYASSSSHRIIVAQTSPPILKSMIGTTIEASFLTRTEEFDCQRLGFRAVVLNILPNYQLHGGGAGEAVELEYLGGPYERNLRYNFRVEPIVEHPVDLTIFGNNERLNVFDVSAGGLCFTRRTSNQCRNIEVGDTLRLSVNLSERERLQLDSRVVRKFYKGHIEYIGVRFSNMQTKDKQILLSALNRIQRIKLRKRSGLHYT